MKNKNKLFVYLNKNFKLIYVNDSYYSIFDKNDQYYNKTTLNTLIHIKFGYHIMILREIIEAWYHMKINEKRREVYQIFE